MDTPLITWLCITGLFAAVIVSRFIRALIFCSKGKHRIIEFGSEREEFFIPGDPAPNGIDYDDFEDL